MNKNMSDYLRLNRMTHIFCPGCGHGTVMNILVRALESLQIDKDKTVFVSGIGCSSRIPGYLDFNTLHTTHGRALAFATGIKMARPELKVIAIMGDGDAAAIGGNHLIHSCRRNIDITALVLNNSIYGMTGGQYSPLTPAGKMATTAPYGCFERSFDLCDLAAAAGATYVARGTTYHVRPMEDYIKAAIEHKGFSLVDLVSQCPTYYGRKNKIGDAVAMLKDMQDNSVSYDEALHLAPHELEDRIVWGEFVKRDDVTEYTELYFGTIASVLGDE